jgi:hypothetical protein
MKGMRDWEPHFGQVTNASPRAILVYPSSHELIRGLKRLFLRDTFTKESARFFLIVFEIIAWTLKHLVGILIEFSELDMLSCSGAFVYEKAEAPGERSL